MAARRRASNGASLERVALMPRQELARRFPHVSDETRTALRLLDTTAINVGLLFDLVRRFVNYGPRMTAQDGPGSGDSAGIGCGSAGSGSGSAGSGSGSAGSGCGSAGSGSGGGAGGVLIFLPGVSEIEQVQRVLTGVLAGGDGVSK